MRRSAILAIVSTTVFAALATPLSAGVMEADKAREKEIRSLEKDILKLQKRYEKLLKRCTGDNRNRPDARACNTAQVTYQDMQLINKQIAVLTKD